MQGVAWPTICSLDYRLMALMCINGVDGVVWIGLDSKDYDQQRLH